jgi:DNA-binding IclR family transcriptional regulator
MTARAVEDGLPKGNVPSVNKAVQILDTLAAAKSAMSLAELTQSVKLPKSTVLAICASLSRTGMLSRLDNGSYRLGTHVLDLAYAYLSNVTLADEFSDLWDSVGIVSGEGAVLAMLDGADIVYIACRNSESMVGISYRLGTRLPANCTATGKALLSTYTDEYIRDLLGRQPLRKLTSKSHKSVTSLLRDLHAVRARGYAIDDEETHEGLCCIGAPVFDSSGGHAVAAVAVSMRKRPGNIGSHPAIRPVLNFSRLLSRRLGQAGSERSS